MPPSRAHGERFFQCTLPVFRDAFDVHGLEPYWTPVDYDLMRKHKLARHSDLTD